MSYYYYKVLGQANPAASTLTTLYTVPASTNAIISTITVCNQAASTATYSIAVRPFGATIDPKHYINYNAAIPASDSIGVTMGLTLAQTDVISVSSSNSSTSFNVFGTHVTETVPVADQTTATSVQYLVVGGGGGGGNTLGGGGGGGGVVAASAYTVTPGTPIVVTVGSGGVGGGPGTNGNNSSIAGGINEYSGLFSGSSQYITVPNNTAFDFGSGLFTIEAWIYPTSFAAQTLIVDKTPNSASYGSFELRVNTNGTLLVYVSSSGSGWDFNFTTSSAVSLNTWNHIALTRTTAGLFTLWINGVSGATYSWNFSIWNSSHAVAIGAYGNGANPFTGYISNFRIINGTALYTTTFTPQVTPFTAITNTSLLTLQNSTFIDNSSNSFAITLGGTPSMTNANTPFNNALGGGYGGTWQGGAGAAGGSGGGGAGSDGNPGANAGASTQRGGYGYAGGNGIIGRLGGGGGGAGGTGYAGGATALSAGTGGVGYQSIITTTSTYFAGGGGGGFESANAGNTYGRGGSGGGGNGGYSNSSYNGTAGTENTGGGGGGGGNQSGSVSGSGAAGGKGIVIIRFSSANYYPATASTNATYTSIGGYNIYTFNSSGTLTI